ncbi:mechanosensitive ion channel [Joostella atrarenae]|uniref:Mechanosensitive ion channel n=1 Tax=Joostella atrarenae TaxID=679257 RepID=A0ABS9J6C2_9FLAO|nr:mechanosensitive ion channel [Joostella atrarenae]MCF8715958.1 mechanosensitive ion channel [Joostella atrarenae]
MRKFFNPFTEQILEFMPSVLGAILVLFIGWLIARGVKSIVVRLLKKTSWDEKILGKADIGNTNKFIGNIFYYVIMIIVIMVVLELLGVSQVLTPVENMVAQILNFVPSIIAGFLIAFAGYLLAKFVSNLINLGGSFLDKLVDKTGFKDTETLVNIIQKVVFILIFVPFLIQAFNALNIKSISEPANLILLKFTDLIGEVLVAAAILVLFIWGGKYLTNLIEDLLKSMKIDSLSEKIQLQKIIGEKRSLAKILSNICYFFIVFFGIITTTEILQLDHLTYTLNEILTLTGQIIFGLLILVIGNYISSLIYNMLLKSKGNNFIAGIVRAASLALFIAIALRTMGIANEIVEIAFTFIMGAIAVTIALSYGLGGREAAGEHFKEIIQKLKSKTPSDKEE